MESTWGAPGFSERGASHVVTSGSSRQTEKDRGGHVDQGTQRFTSLDVQECLNRECREGRESAEEPDSDNGPNVGAEAVTGNQDPQEEGPAHIDADGDPGKSSPMKRGRDEIAGYDTCEASEADEEEHSDVFALSAMFPRARRGNPPWPLPGCD